MLSNLAASAIFAISFTGTSVQAFRCGADPGSKSEIAAAEQRFQSLVATRPASQSTGATATVPVHWNIYYDQDNPSDGNITDTAVQKTMDVINYFFAQQIGLTFNLAETNRIGVDNDTLHGIALGNQAEANLKSERPEGAGDLYLYIVGSNPNPDEGGIAGWATFPEEYEEDKTNDGVVYINDFLPEGKSEGFNTGKIMVHEIGHWLGLYHTFQDGCDDEDGKGGDFVADTPSEAEPGSGCPADNSVDTCPSDGYDPIHNMMDYTNDECRTEFTAGQYARIKDQISVYRGINL